MSKLNWIFKVIPVSDHSCSQQSERQFSFRFPNIGNVFSRSQRCNFSLPFPKFGNGLSYSRSCSQSTKSHSHSPMFCLAKYYPILAKYKIQRAALRKGIMKTEEWQWGEPLSPYLGKFPHNPFFQGASLNIQYFAHSNPEPLRSGQRACFSSTVSPALDSPGSMAKRPDTYKFRRDTSLKKACHRLTLANFRAFTLDRTESCDVSFLHAVATLYIHTINIISNNA